MWMGSVRRVSASKYIILQRGGVLFLFVGSSAGAGKAANLRAEIRAKRLCEENPERHTYEEHIRDA